MVRVADYSSINRALQALKRMQLNSLTFGNRANLVSTDYQLYESSVLN